MKAKEYAEIVKKGNYDHESVQKVVTGLLGEVRSLSEARGVTTVRGLESIVREIRQKWVAIANRSNGNLNKKGFDEFLIGKKLLNLDLTLNLHFWKK